ncbi:D-alanyl-D-alanine carboxypeptidase (penicillin-binding protein 5/6) [Sporobacter termitidis DSM 10068]|uniref:D-alanyl-D-alanine carboxypeptidase (Penicillin-binding protein 5/6) n=1 Tax=Sporobacter termitidis DSM 10068 TaxID=1123282 RepID=A0A1M5U4Y0_9FIRM|nr:serine hydrolase [Sporobacter termitidis]SHH57921.1 D-alanyl-D-alanine carboxypeptidase (penicillin-binding protein 5/6) [Sporobacter termitidis DSM 10068]
MRKFNIFTVFLILLTSMSALALPPASALDEPDLTAETALLVESGTGQILYEKNKDAKVPAGGTAAVMTLLLAVEAVEDGSVALSDTVEASETAVAAAGKSGGDLSLAAEETMSFQDLMYIAGLVSAGDACNIIAEHVSGSIGAFTEKMNEKAAGLGCTGTHFTSPGGSDDPDQYTTAWDQFLIFHEAAEHQMFMRLSGTPAYTTGEGGSAQARTIENADLMLLGNSQYFYGTCTAGKADVSNGSYTLISCAKDKNMTLISVITGAADGKSGTAEDQGYTEARRLLDWGFSGYVWQDLVGRDDIVATEKIDLANGADSIELKPAAAVSALVPTDLQAADCRKDIVIYNQEAGETLTAPVRKGAVLGEMTVYLDNAVRGKVQLVAARDVPLDKPAYIKGQISKTLSSVWFWLGLVLFLLLTGGYIMIVVKDWRKRRELKRRMEERRKQIIAARQKKTTEETERIEEAERTEEHEQINV